MSTAYAVWTGISVAGTVLVDLLADRQVDLPRLACIALILAGTTGLNLVAQQKPRLHADEAAAARAAR